MISRRILLALACLFATTLSTRAQPEPPPQVQATTPQQPVTRDATREQLRAVLDTAGPKIDVAFRQSDKQPYNFVGLLKTGLKNADTLEVVISVSAEQTIHFRIFPHYKDAYVNIDKVVSGTTLMRQLLLLSDQNFLYWGADASGDIFAGYNFTLESGFPEASIRVVLSSISQLDDFVGRMKPAIDGSEAR